MKNNCDTPNFETDTTGDVTYIYRQVRREILRDKLRVIVNDMCVSLMVALLCILIALPWINFNV